MRKFFGKRSKIANFFSSLFYYGIAIPLLFVYNKLVYGLKISGRKNLKKLKKKGAISVSNHVHTLDCTMNALAMFPRKVHFTSLKSNFHIPVAGGILHFVGVIPVADKVSEMPIFFTGSQRTCQEKTFIARVCRRGTRQLLCGAARFQPRRVMIARSRAGPHSSRRDELAQTPRSVPLVSA